MVRVIGSFHHLDGVAEESEVIRRLVACVVLADGLCMELGKAPLRAAEGWNGGDGLRFLDGRIELDELRQIAARNLGAEARVPM